MRRCFVALTAVLALVSPSLASPPPGQPEAIETALAKIDLKQKDMVIKADVAGPAALAAPGLTINAPTGRVLTREQFLAMMRNGQIGAESFERRIESVTVAGDVGR